MTGTAVRWTLYAVALGIVLAGSTALYASAYTGSVGPMMGGCGGMMSGGAMKGRMGGGMMGGDGSHGSMSGGDMTMGRGTMGGDRAGTADGMMGDNRGHEDSTGGGMMGGGDRPNQQWRH